MGEKPLCKALDAAVSITSFRPIEYCKHHRHGNRIDRLTIRNERRVVFRFEFTQSVVVCERLSERDRDQVEAGVRRNSVEEIDRLANHEYKRSNFA